MGSRGDGSAAGAGARVQPGWRLGAAVLVLVLGGAVPAHAQAGAPAGPVPAERLAARRASLLAKLGHGVALIRSAKARPDEEHAQDSGFRQNDDFFYLTGLEESGALLVGLAGEGGAGGSWRLYLPDRVPMMEQWTGARLGPGAEARALTGVEDVRSAARAAAEVRALVEEAGPDAGLWIGGAVAEGCTAGAEKCADPLVGPALSASHGPVASLKTPLGRLRVVKDADELARLRQAAAITGAALVEAMTSAHPGMKEYQLETIIEAGFHRRGAERVGFPTIVGSGPNSTVLHYDVNRREMQAGDLVVMDVGAEYGYYTADVTRTIPVSGSFSERQRAIYQLVLGAQRAVIDSIRPGMAFTQMDRVARAYLRAHSGVLCGIELCDRYLNHGVSHWIGMDVHDVGPYGTLQPGMVLTVEPGLYIAKESLGVRIEDDVLVTASGHEVLTQGAPKDPAEIEQLMRSGSQAGRSAK